MLPLGSRRAPGLERTAGRLKRSTPTGDEDEPPWGAFTPGGKLMIDQMRRNLHLWSDRSEYAGLLLQRDGRFSAIRVRKTDPAALTRDGGSDHLPRNCRVGNRAFTRVFDALWASTDAPHPLHCARRAHGLIFSVLPRGHGARDRVC